MGDDDKLEARQRVTGIVVAAGLLVLVFGCILTMVLQPGTSSTPVWFVMMLVVMAAAMTLVAIVFRWLGLHGKDEAFGLPPGSIRTLLAVGVMVLFTVFGLNFSASPNGPKPSGQAFAVVAAAAAPAERASEVERYLKRNIVAVEVPATSASAPAQLQLHWLEGAVSADVADMRKQVVTALITLLTSVVSFYFGSRSAEGARGAGAGSGAPSDLPEVTRSHIESLRKRLAEAGARHARLKTAGPTNDANTKALGELLVRADVAMKAVTEGLSRLENQAKDLSKGVGTAEAVEASATDLQRQADALDTLLAQGEALVAVR